MNLSIKQSERSRNSRIEKRLKVAQIGSAIVFLPFLLIHLANAVLGFFGPDAYQWFQSAAQQIYQFPLIEMVFVLAPLVIHMISGLTLMLINRGRKKHRSLGRRLHTWAGLFLALVVLGHVVATRGLPWAYDFHAGFAGVSFSLWWMPWYFYPYYFLLFMAGSYHSLHGSKILAQRLFSYKLFTSTRQLQLVMLVAAVMISAALLSFGGHVRDNPDPRDNDFARLYQTLFNLEFQL
ncbi:MAG: hypothetical protein AB8B48_16170 [Pseudomonadales bacterium]